MARKLSTQPKAGNGGDGRQLSPTDNMTDAEKRRAREEADQVMLLSGISQLRPLMDKSETAAALAKEAKGAVTNFRKVLCGQIGMTAEVLDEIMADQAAVRRDVVAREEARAYFRRLAGQVVGRSEEQIEMEDRLPPAERDKQHWEGDGYAAGLRAAERRPPSECPPHQDIQQAWLAAYDAGQAKNIMALQKSAEASKPPEPNPEPEKEESAYMRKKREKAEQEALLASLEKQADEILEDGEESPEYQPPEPDFV